MLLPLLLTSLSAVSAAVCPRGFLIHPARDRIFCLSVPGAEYVDVESPYTLGVLVEQCRDNAKHQQWRWQRSQRDGKEVIWLQNLATADREYPENEEGPPELYSFCVTSGYWMPGEGPGGSPTLASAGTAVKFDLCTNVYENGQNWYLRGNQIKGNPIIDPSDGQQKEQCLDVRNGDWDKGIVQMWYCVDGNTNQQWEVEPL